MRRFFVYSLGLMFLAGCSELEESSPLDVSREEDPALPTAMELFDGTSALPGANPHFYFLPPLAGNTPGFSGVADEDLEPTVIVCPFASWDFAGESCATPLAAFTVDPDDFGNSVSAGSTYNVVWKTNDFPVTQGQVFRVAVSVVGKVLGWVDVKAYDQATYSSFQHTDPDGYVAISDNGNLNIKFRIEEGALEAEYCDPDAVEDCDVMLFKVDETGCLQVFERPGSTEQILGSQACVPANAAELDGEPVEGVYAVILTLEKAQVFQGGAVPTGLQVPYFPDLETFPPGIEFDATSDGVQVVICQVESGVGSIPEALHPQLRPFLVYSDGTTVLPEDYSFGAPECDDLGEPFALGRPGDRDFLGRFAAGLSRVSSLFLPKPLMARRLHGGLNTTVYNTRVSPGGGGGEGSPFLIEEEDFVVELGAILNVSPMNSTAAVPGTGQVGAESTLTIHALNGQGLPYPFEVAVTVDIASGADQLVGLVTYEGDGVYSATYTPTTVGTDVVTITIDAEEMAGSPYASNIAPRSVDASASTFEISYSEVGAGTTVTVQVLDTEGDPYLFGGDFPIDVQVSVTGANTATITAADSDGDGTYLASYTPESYGDDQITVTIDGTPTGDSPTTVTTAPRPVDPAGSTATLASTADVPSGGQVDAPTNITITVVNEAGEPYDYSSIRPIDVQVSVSGANTVAAFGVGDPDGNGTFETAYTPAFPGSDLVTITIDGIPISGSPFGSEVVPLSGDLKVVVNITGPGIAPEDGLPVNLYSGSNLVGTVTTDASGAATFADVDFGPYTVHLPKRDFDAAFSTMTRSVDHQSDEHQVTFDAVSAALPEGVSVYRVRAGGNGNAFRYVLNNRSWTSAQNQVRTALVLGVPGHLATIHGPGENQFVANLVGAKCPNETNENKCKYQGWIGLSDADSEGNFRWVTGETLTFTSWKAREPSGRNNEDHVEINLFGLWTDENGASSTNEGYVVEWEVVWPATPPF